MRVVYIAGWGRSGTTLLANILGSVPGLTSVGELYALWKRNLAGDVPCGCGAPFDACDFWNEVRTLAFGEDGWPEPDHVAGIGRRTRTRRLAGLAMPRADLRIARQMRAELETLRSLYRAIEDASGGATIVDCSKNPGYGWILSLLEDIELHVVLMVRDPRAVAFSWANPRHEMRGGRRVPLKRHGAVASSLLWSIRNTATEALLRPRSSSYQTVRYEDFARNPRETVETILDRVGAPVDELPFTDDSTAVLEPSHTTSGNPVRFALGPVRIVEDERWKTLLSRPAAGAATLIGLPLLGRYGYRIMGARSS